RARDVAALDALDEAARVTRRRDLEAQALLVGADRERLGAAPPKDARSVVVPERHEIPVARQGVAHGRGGDDLLKAAQILAEDIGTDRVADEDGDTAVRDGAEAIEVPDF